MLVKVCGITTLEAAQIVANESADFIGFVFAPSTRQIDPLNAQKISKKTTRFNQKSRCVCQWK